MKRRSIAIAVATACIGGVTASGAAASGESIAVQHDAVKTTNQTATSFVLESSRSQRGGDYRFWAKFRVNGLRPPRTSAGVVVWQRKTSATAWKTLVAVRPDRYGRVARTLYLPRSSNIFRVVFKPAAGTDYQQAVRGFRITRSY